MKRLAMIVAAAAIAAACSPKSDAGEKGEPGAASPVIPKPNAAAVTPQQLAKLKWIEGYWRGAAPDGSTFYEQYTFVDDSTISMYAFPYEDLAAPNDSALIILRGGVLRDAGQTASWVATRLDSAAVDFAPEWGATNTFTWAKDGDSWTATIQSGSGVSKSIAVYRMRRANR